MILSEQTEFLSFPYDGVAVLCTYASPGVISDLVCQKPVRAERESPIEEDFTEINLKHHYRTLKLANGPMGRHAAQSWSDL